MDASSAAPPPNGTPASASISPLRNVVSSAPKSGSGEGSTSLVPSPYAHFDLLRDVEVEITLEIGRRRMRIADILRLGTGQTLELAKAVGEPLDIYVNGRLLGRGEAIVTGDRYGVRITELVGTPGADGKVLP